MGLKRTGVELVVDRAPQFFNTMRQANTAVDDFQTKVAKGAKGSMSLKLPDVKGGKTLSDLIPESIRTRLSGMKAGLDSVTGSLGNMIPGLSGATGGVSSLASSISGLIPKLGLVGGALAIVTAAVIGLGMRGAAMPGVIEAFDITSQRAGTLSQTLLTDLRTAARGTITDIELMKTANLALAGAEPKVAAALGKEGGLAGLLEIARVQARATGQDVDYLFDSLVIGIKRGSTLMIDNTGLVLSEGKANEAYAKSLGKTVEQLTAQEKQIALLNATLEAGKSAVSSYGKGAATAAEQIAQIKTTISDTLDRLSVSIQPLFQFILSVGQSVLEVVIVPIRDVLIPVIYELTNAVFGPLRRAWEGTWSGIKNVFAPVATLIHRWLLVIIGVIRGVGSVLGWLLKQVGTVLKPVAGFFKKYLVEPVSKALDPTEFAQRGGFAFGALAQGILMAANTLIFPAVIAIAQFIADFLMGFSPPKRGPLARIDEGGANVMEAWLGGFTGADLSPVRAMVESVNAELGSIGQLTFDQVTKRLDQLDVQLQPFVDMLDIAKSKMESLIEPLKQVQDLTEKRLQKQLEKFLKGQASAESVRALDKQSEALSDRIGLFEDITTEAEYQLVLKKAEQARERALLEIQKRRTESKEKQTTAEKDAAAAAEKAAAGGAGAGTPAEAAAGGAAGFDVKPSDNPVADWLSGFDSGEVSAMWGEMKTSFMEGFNLTGADEQLATARGNLGKLNEQFGRIKGSKPFQFLSKAVDTVFGTGPDSIIGKVTAFKDQYLSPLWDSIFGDGGVLDSVGLLDPITTAFDTVFNFVKGNIPNILTGFKAYVGVLFGPLGVLAAVFSSFSLEGVKNTFSSVFNFLTGSIPVALRFFKQLVSDLFALGKGTLSVLFGAFSLDAIKQTFTDIFDATVGAIPGVINGFIDKVGSIFSDAKDSPFGKIWTTAAGVIKNMFLGPVQTILNGVIDLFVEGINKIIDVVGDAIDAVNKVNPFGDIDKPGKLNAADYHVNLVGARKGGLFGPGLAEVHQGETVMGSASRFAVFPRRWVEAMETIAGAATRSRTVYGGMGGSTDQSSHINTSITANFNSRDNRQNVRMRLSELRGMA